MAQQPQPEGCLNIQYATTTKVVLINNGDKKSRNKDGEFCHYKDK